MNMNILATKIGALHRCLKNRIAIFSKMSLMTLIKFQSFMKTISLHKTASVVSSENNGTLTKGSKVKFQFSQKKYEWWEGLYS
jgi:hypothetical protein